jgi:hypothetical protein
MAVGYPITNKKAKNTPAEDFSVVVLRLLKRIFAEKRMKIAENVNLLTENAIVNK